MTRFEPLLLLLSSSLLSFAQVAARYDPLQNTTQKYPNLLDVGNEFDILVSSVRDQNSRFQQLYSYEVDSPLQWTGGVNSDATNLGSSSSSSGGALCLDYVNGGGDNLLQNLRAGYLQEIAPQITPDALKVLARDDDSFRVTIPNVGQYDGLEASTEYVHIAVGSSNDGFSTTIRSTVVEESPYFAKRDVMAVTLPQLRDWNMGQLVRPNLFFNELDFRPCSVALDGMTTTFDDTGIEAFLDQQFSNRYLCERMNHAILHSRQPAI